jgi:hypothetical protein
MKMSGFTTEFVPFRAFKHVWIEAVAQRKGLRKA